MVNIAEIPTIWGRWLIISCLISSLFNPLQ